MDTKIAILGVAVVGGLGYLLWKKTQPGPLNLPSPLPNAQPVSTQPVSAQPNLNRTQPPTPLAAVPVNVPGVGTVPMVPLQNVPVSLGAVLSQIPAGSLNYGTMSPMDIQHALNVLGTTPPLPETGIMDPVTVGELLLFQNTVGLPGTGSADPATVAALQMALAAHEGQHTNPIPPNILQGVTLPAGVSLNPDGTLSFQ